MGDVRCKLASQLFLLPTDPLDGLFIFFQGINIFLDGTALFRDLIDKGLSSGYVAGSFGMSTSLSVVTRGLVPMTRM